jgi:hypothetical protein
MQWEVVSKAGYSCHVSLSLNITNNNAYPAFDTASLKYPVLQLKRIDGIEIDNIPMVCQ